MRYLALGDSISIDDYTGETGGGAASQFANLLAATEFLNLTVDGCTTNDLLTELERGVGQWDVITVTVCGNDLLQMLDFNYAEGGDAKEIERIIRRYDQILAKLRPVGCPIIVNTVYDPTDGRNDVTGEMGLLPQAREFLESVNRHIRQKAKSPFVLSDLVPLFAGHGFWSAEPWLVYYVEPNLAGATAIAKHWHGLFSQLAVS